MADQHALKTHGAVSRARFWVYDPAKLHVATDPKDPWFNPRNLLPIQEDFVEDIIARGVIEAIEVVKDGVLDDGTPRFVVENGNQRVLHCRVANERLIAAGKEPYMVEGKQRRGTENDLALEAQALNSFRRDSPPGIKAQEFQRLVDKKVTQAEIARVNRISEASVSEYLALNNCSSKVLAALNLGQITMRAALKLAGKPRDEQNKEVAALVGQAAGKPVKANEVAQAPTPPARPKVRPAKHVTGLQTAIQRANKEPSDYVKGVLSTLKWMAGKGQLKASALGLDDDALKELGFKLNPQNKKDKKDQP